MHDSDTMARIRDDLLSAFALLSRLPLPDHAPQGARSSWGWPLVGAVLGGLAAAAAGLCGLLGLTPGVAAAVALATLAALTGALHEDGLADTADGLFGGWTRERRLEIMKDSRIGSFGALALMLVMVAAWSALTDLAATGGAGWALVAAGALSRAPMAVVMAALPNARGAGLSQSVGRPTVGVVGAGCGLALVIGLFAAGSATLAAVALSAAGVTALALTARARIGGQTGDILGASQQLAHLACLAVFAAALT